MKLIIFSIDALFSLIVTALIVAALSVAIAFAEQQYNTPYSNIKQDVSQLNEQIYYFCNYIAPCNYSYNQDGYIINGTYVPGYYSIAYALVYLNQHNNPLAIAYIETHIIDTRYYGICVDSTCYYYNLRFNSLEEQSISSIYANQTIAGSEIYVYYNNNAYKVLIYRVG
ncbi:MAG: hypothetical protein ARM1_0844 [Candidatus Micrarchaeota archaeon]|nr:MAG: hypothetical protein ARM1_0844 [Candidatus Micrarchaeota archaeon]